MNPQLGAGARIGPSLGRLGLHDHACLIVDPSTSSGQASATSSGRAPGDQRFEIFTSFLQIGLERGERCLYVADENTAGRIMPHLRAAGIDPGQALASGSLVITTGGGSSLGCRSPEGGDVLSALESEIDAALGDGYPALRVVGEASWAPGKGARLEHLVEHEERLKRLFRDRPAVALWQYDRWRCSPALLRELVRMHPYVIVRGDVHRNGLYVPPGERTGERSKQDELQRALDTIVDRARDEEGFTRRMEQLQRALEGGAHALWEWDLESGRVALETRWAEMPGIEPSRPAVPLSEWEQHIHPDDLGPTWKRARDHVDGRSHRLEHECRMRDRTGKWRWVHLRAKAVGRDPAGRPVRISGTATDVSELRAIRDRHVASDQLALASRLADRMAHEVNNPLAWMTTNLGFMKELLQRSQGASPLAAEDVSRLLEVMGETEEGASRVREAVEAIPKAFASFGKGKPAPRDLREEIKSALAAARTEIVPRARLKVSLPDELPRALAQEHALAQVFRSLLVNAARSIPEGSPEDNEVRLAAHAQGDQAVVEVTDTGAGMSPHTREHMFDLHFTAHTRKTAEFGTGLFVSRAIVERSGGRIEVESEPARGTTVRVVLPAAREGDGTAE